jgi:hypothetical protein
LVKVYTVAFVTRTELEEMPLGFGARDYNSFSKNRLVSILWAGIVA